LSEITAFEDDEGSRMGKHDVEMSPSEQQRVIDTARDLAVEFDKVGGAADEANAFPMSLVALFKQSGLVGLNVPKEYGGLGGDIWTTSRVARALAYGDPGCALAFNMHFTMTGIFRGLLSADKRAEWFPRIAQGDKIVCGPFSEERAGLTGLADTVAVPVADGFRISGRKTWGTLCQAADIVAFNATVTDEGGQVPSDFMQHGSQECVFILPMDTQGITIQETWDALGMRATGTHTVVFDNVMAPAGALAGDFRGGLFGEFEWAALSFSGVYQGLMDKAYDETVRILRRKTLGATMEGADVALKGLGYVQHGLGKMFIDKESCSRMLETSCKMLIDGRDTEWDPIARVAMVDLPKIVITEKAIELASAGMRLVGGSAFRRGHLLERLYRDSRSGPFHPLTTDQAYDYIGRFDLGLLSVPG
jgi:alkylation response protein AidB-like acyl-CoA dehydrogenase